MLRFASVLFLACWACSEKPAPSPATPPAQNPPAGIPGMPELPPGVNPPPNLPPGMNQAPTTPPPIEKPEDYPQLKIETVKAGTGDELKWGMKAKVHYTGMMMSGTVFDSSRFDPEPPKPEDAAKAAADAKANPGMPQPEKRKYGTPFDVVVSNDPAVGGGNLIKGWIVGLQGMKVGERRKLTVPPDLAYGKYGNGRIPGEATLIFDVELVEITK